MRKRDLWILAAAVCAAAALVITQFFTKTIPTGAWGLSFQQEGAAPSAPVGPEGLKGYGAAYLADPGEKVIYLTFDAGYENGTTEKILDALKKHNASACFFLVGNFLEKNADLVRRMVDEGHTVGNHTMNHKDMSAISDPREFARELTGVEELYREITGEPLPKYYRPPQGIYSEESLKMARQMGYKTVFWSLAYADWDNNAQPTREQAMEKLLSRVHNGAVVLLHSTSRTNAEILDELLTGWEQMGYTFAPISRLFSS